MTKNSTDQKVLLVTGSSRGIGKHIAEYYCEKNFLVLGCSTGQPTFEHINYRHFIVDLISENDILNLIVEIRKSYKKLDILINNAAINPAIMSCALVPYSTMEKIFKINVFAPMLLCREAVKLMMRNKTGRIINMGSMAAKLEVPGEGLYTSTKVSLNAYSRVLAKEVYKLGITVNVLAPSAILTDLSAKINQNALNEVLSKNAVPHYGAMQDVTNTLDYLIKDESNAITGQIIYLGGV